MTLPRHSYKRSVITPGQCGAEEYLTAGHIRCCGLPETHLAHDVALPPKETELNALVPDPDVRTGLAVTSEARTALWFEDPDRLRAAAPRYVDAIKGRMAADRAASDSDAEIERTLSPCVGGNFLVPLAKHLRDDGVSLVEPLAPLEPYREPEVSDYFKAKDFVDQATLHALSLLVVDGTTEDVRELACKRLKTILIANPELNAMLSEAALVICIIPDQEVRMELSAIAQKEIEYGIEWEWFQLASNEERDEAVSVRMLEIAKDPKRLASIIAEVDGYRAEELRLQQVVRDTEHIELELVR